MTQYSELPPERWARFDLGQQILQIGVEMQRGLKFPQPGCTFYLRACYERAMQLVDLTLQVQQSPDLQRELKLWCGLAAELYQREEPDPRAHPQAQRVLLLLNPESA